MEILANHQLSNLTQFNHDGVIIFRNLITSQQITILKNEINIIRNYVMQKIKNMDRPLQTYTDIAERHLGRLDYRCGFKGEIFDEVAKPIIQIVNSLSPTITFRHYWGAIPSLAGSGPTNMHRDIYPFLNTKDDIDHYQINLPPFYFTVLIPLMQITNENGPTQFIKGSHLQEMVDENSAEIYAPLLSSGDVIIFDGRTLHKGSANNSQEERSIAYITFVANWYHDQTFTFNNYLFPELS